MKKILEILMFASLGIFFVVCSTSEAFASGSNSAPPGTQSYYFSQAQINDDATGNYAPSPIQYETNYTNFRFGYFDVTDTTFPKNERIRMTSLYCSTRRTTDTIFNRYTLDGNVGMEILDFQYKNMGACAATDSQGHIEFLGRYIFFQIDFRIPSDSSLGFANYTFFSNTAGGKHTIKFINYKISYNDEAIKEDIIDNNNQNTQDIINNQDKNNQDLIDNQNKNQEETNKRLDAINDTLNDDTPPNSDISGLGNVQGLLPPGPVDSLLNIPFKFLSIIVSSFGNSDTCKSMKFNFVFDCPVELPCFNSFYSQVPSYLMIFIDTIPSGLILIFYFKHLYKKIDRAVSMETNSDDEWGVI